MVGSEIDPGSGDGGESTTGGIGTGATLLGFATFFLATFFAVVAGLRDALALLRAGFVAFLATFFALLAVFAGRVFFFTTLLFAPVCFAVPTERFFDLLFFFAMITFLLAVLRLLAVRVALKKSAVICV